MYPLLVLLAFYSEDVIRTVEREIRKSEALIRERYPGENSASHWEFTNIWIVIISSRGSSFSLVSKHIGAEYIELEPMSVDVDRLAIDDNLEAELRRVEGEALDRFLRSLRSESTPSSETQADSSDTSPAPSKL